MKKSKETEQRGREVGVKREVRIGEREDEETRNDIAEGKDDDEVD